MRTEARILFFGKEKEMVFRGVREQDLIGRRVVEFDLAIVGVTSIVQVEQVIGYLREMQYAFDRSGGLAPHFEDAQVVEQELKQLNLQN